MQKSDLKTGDHHNIFKRSKDQKYYVTKVEQKKLFTFFISIFMVSLTQKLTYTINIYLTLCLAHFLNKIIY